MNKWTYEQEQAIYSRNSNLLVSAAAGSGKTAVLVERIVQLLVQDQRDIHHFLVVTYTRAAAAEMKERILNSLIQAMELYPEYEGYLRRQIYALNSASISTIHAFCLEVVREYFYLVDVDPHFRMADEIEARLLRQEALETVLEDAYMEQDEGFIGFVERLANGATDSGMSDIVLRMYSFIQSQPEPMQWLQTMVEAYQMTEEEFLDSLWVKSMQADIMVQLKGAEELLKQARLCAQAPEGPAEYLSGLEQDLALLEELQTTLQESFFDFCSALAGLEFARLKPIRNPANLELKNYCKDLRDQAKDTLDSLNKQLGWCQASTAYGQLQSMAPYLAGLARLCRQFDDKYAEKKRERGILDFSDLEHYALEILAHDDIAGAYRQYFDYIFVDEYQDSNLVQETIINCICRHDNLFMVGDVKQSIYRFRQADPGLFMDKFQRFQCQEDALDRRIDLNRNFRSRSELLAGVNYIFQHIMSPSLGEMEYDASAFLYPGRVMPGEDETEIDLILLENDAGQAEADEESEEDKFAVEDLTNTRLEALYIAQEIKDLLGTSIYDSKREEYRPVEYRDIVVLMRATRSQASIFTEEFLACGIPAFADANSGYFETVELSVFINLLHLIDNRRQDIPLLSVMRSSICLFSEEELLDIRLHDPEKAFYEAAEAYALNENDAIAEKIRGLTENLDRWQEQSTYLPMEEFIWTVVQDTGYDIYVSAMPGGEQRQANMRILLEKARKFEQSTMKGLFSFLRYIEQIQARQEDVEMARILGENDNVVRIMSIHKSKGLEFPIVFVAGMGRQFNRIDLNAPLLMHKELGLGSYDYDLENRVKSPTLPRIVIRQKNRMEHLAEEMRILYVACTRARERLFLVGSTRDMSSALKKWSKPVHPFILAQARSYLDWVVPVVMRHPDGAPLREAFYEDMELDLFAPEDSKWRVSVLNTDELRHKQEDLAEAVNIKKQQLQSFCLDEYDPRHDEIMASLNWNYPGEGATHLPAKISVTELTLLQEQGILDLLPEMQRGPAFLQADHGIRAAELGSAVHLLMQHVDFGIQDEEELRSFIQVMVERELLSEQSAESIHLKPILAFLQTPLCNRIRQAKQLYREQAFNLLLDAAELNQTETGVQLLVQGIIDLYFEEDDGLVLVDYKTDRVKGSDPSPIIKRYTGQVELYKRALEEITGKTVKEAYLYLFDLQKAVQLW